LIDPLRIPVFWAQSSDSSGDDLRMYEHKTSPIPKTLNFMLKFIHQENQVTSWNKVRSGEPIRVA